MLNAVRNLSGIQAEFKRNPRGNYPCHIHAWFHAASRFHANFTQNTMQNAMQNLSGIQAESKWNVMGMYPCLIHACFHAASRFHADFTRISRWFHAQFHAECYAEYKRNPRGIQAKSEENLPISNPCLIPCSKQISRKFQADFTRIPSRMLCGMLAESKRNQGEIREESTHA